MSNARRYWLIAILVVSAVLAACTPTTAPSPTPRPPTATTAPADSQAATEEATEELATEEATEAVVEAATEEATEEGTEVAMVDVTEAATEEATEAVVEAATEEPTEEPTTEVIVLPTDVITEEPTATEVEPTATDVPPTETEVPPTATDVPPTATEVPPTETPTEEPTEEATVEATEEATAEPTEEVDALAAAVAALGDTSEMTVAEIVTALAEGDQPEFTTLLAAVSASPAVASLTSNLTVTVFAPTDEAFAAALEALDMSAEDVLGNETLLTTLLRYHITYGRVASTDLEDGQVIRTASGGTITVSIEDGHVQLIDGQGNEVELLAVDIPASNGIIHVISAVLLPPM